MFNKLKQFKDLRDQAKTMQSELAKESLTVTELGGDISITMDGNLEVTDLTIAESLFSPDKKKKVEKGVIDAFTGAKKKMQKVMATKMREMGGLPNIPGLS